MSLSEIQIIVIEKKLIELGLNYHPLHDEMLDHVCCMIEAEMDRGASYHGAEIKIFNQLKPELIQTWQKQTKNAIYQKQNLMKHLSIITTGLAASCLLITSVINAQDLPSINPVAQIKVTSHFGQRVDPISKEEKWHAGIDLKASTGTPVVATADGVIAKVENDPQGYGKFIVIDHGEQIFSKYAQLSAFKVDPGQTVTRGEIIGLVGSSGASTAPHLHYEVIKNNKAVDPSKYMALPQK